MVTMFALKCSTLTRNIVGHDGHPDFSVSCYVLQVAADRLGTVRTDYSDLLLTVLSHL